MTKDDSINQSFPLSQNNYYLRNIPIENLKHIKMLDPLGQAWQNGSGLAA